MRVTDSVLPMTSYSGCRGARQEHAGGTYESMFTGPGSLRSQLCLVTLEDRYVLKEGATDLRVGHCAFRGSIPKRLI